MSALYRARASLLLAGGLATALLVVELPIGELLHQRTQLALVSGELARVDATNAALAGDITALGKAATIASIAHAEYGLVRSGQRAYSVVAPGSSGAVAPGLASHVVPGVDLVLSSANALLAEQTTRPRTNVDGTPATGSLWSRVLDRLEFWRWAF